MKNMEIEDKDFISIIEGEYDVKVIKTGDIYNVYTLDNRLIFLTSKASNVIEGLKLLYGKKEV